MIFLGARFYTDDMRVHALYTESLEVFKKDRAFTTENEARVARGEEWIPLPDEINGTLFMDTRFPGLRTAVYLLSKTVSAVETKENWPSTTVVHQEGVLRIYCNGGDLGVGYLIGDSVPWALPPVQVV